MAATVLALGAWLKNAACLVQAEGEVLWSPLHGDLGTPEACTALSASAQALLARAGGRVEAVAHDLHPDFFSTRLAQQLAQSLGVPAIAVQHHHAHLAVVVAEHGLGASRHVGLALDGVGLGDDGTAWGGELLQLDGAACARIGHLHALPLPGGDAAAREPWRMAAAALHALGRGDEIERRWAPQVGAASARGVAQMLARGLKCPPSSSTGRWFDAAAATLGLCLRQQDEAQAAIALEQAASRWLQHEPAPDVEPVPVAPDAAGQLDIDLRPLLARLSALADAGADPGAGAALFHLTLADALARAAHQAARAAGTDTVLLGGGCFFNRLLTAQLGARLQALQLRARRPDTHNCGDAGLALGQAWVAQQQLRLPRDARPLPGLKETCPCA